MSAEDKAKARAEERAERELQLKIDALELEREKFRHAKGQAIHDRLGAAVVRAAAALLFANASVLVVCLNSYRSLTEVVPAATLYGSVIVLKYSFILAAVAFVSALVFGASSIEAYKKRFLWALGPYIMFGLCGIPSLILFLWALMQAFNAVKVP